MRFGIRQRAFGTPPTSILETLVPWSQPYQSNAGTPIGYSSEDMHTSEKSWKLQDLDSTQLAENWGETD